MSGGEAGLAKMINVTFGFKMVPFRRSTADHEDQHSTGFKSTRANDSATASTPLDSPPLLLFVPRTAPLDGYSVAHIAARPASTSSLRDTETGHGDHRHEKLPRRLEALSRRSETLTSRVTPRPSPVPAHPMNDLQRRQHVQARKT